MFPLVNNMEDRKNPWDDVPVEVLIEFEREKLQKQKQDQERPRLHLPVLPYNPVEEDNNSDDPSEEHKIVIQLF
jgi:hypothetical protein